ncbi:MAG: aminotransferase class V-fold PLP-dependent enzyme [Candidatus Limnocylindrales bacterium]
MVAPFQPESEKVAAIREALPSTAAGIYLNTGTAGPQASEAVRAMRELEEREARVGRADTDYFLDFLERAEETRAVLAAAVAGKPDEIALAAGATGGMNVATWAPDWRPGDRAVTTNQEHAGGLGPLLAVRDRCGVELALVDLAEGRDEARLLEAFAAAITPRTRLVSVSHVSWTTGTLLPIKGIAELARTVGAWMVVDGAQAAGILPVQVAALGADFYAYSGQKWLLGPEGTGALWASPRAVEEAEPLAGGYFGFEHLEGNGTGARWASARRFESVTYHRPSIVGLGRSVGWLEMYVGLAWAAERATRLARAAAARLAAVPGVTLLTPQERMATLVTFRVAGWSAEELRVELGRRIFAITRTIPDLDALRISVGWFNTEDELETFVGAVAELARTTPAALPVRAGLAIVSGDLETPS